MRATTFAASLLWLTNLAFGQPSSLNALEQGLQAPAAPGGAAAAANGYLGAELDDAGENNQGVRVKAVRPGTPAEVSGLKSNDLIVSIDGKKVANLDDYDSVAKRPAGAKMVFIVDRSGRQQSVAVTLGTKTNSAAVSDQGPSELQPAAPSLTAPGGAPSSTPSASSPFGSALPSSSPSLIPPAGTPPSTLPAPSESSPRSGGITAQPLDTRPSTSDSFTPPSFPAAPGTSGASGSGKASLGITVDSSRQPPSRAIRRGAYIADVKPGSPAAIASLPVGGVIVQVDGQKINSDEELINAIRSARPGQEVELTYYDTADRLGKKMVRLGEAGAAPGAASAPSTGGFAAPGSIPAPSEPSTRPGIGGGGRPLINRVEQMAENFGRGAGLAPSAPLKTTTVYDPLAMAALQRTVEELTAVVNRLDERVRALEGRSGGTSSSPLGSPSSLPPSASPSFGSPQTPGFNSPSPSITPGFGPSGTNP